MIIVISAYGKELDSEIYKKFERSNFFLIVDIDQNTALPITNVSRDKPHEIGGPIGKMIAKLGIDVIITTDIGPKAFEIFSQKGIKIYRGEGIIEDTIKQLELGKLSQITKATVPNYSNWKKNNDST